RSSTSRPVKSGSMGSSMRHSPAALRPKRERTIRAYLAKNTGSSYLFSFTPLYSLGLVLAIQMTARKCLPVILVDQAQALKRQVGVDLIDQVAVGSHHASHAAGRDNSCIAAQFFLNIRDYTGQRAYIAAHRSRLHGLHGRLANCMLRPLNVHARQFGCLEEQRFHRHLEAREDCTALVGS